jgi:acyl-CoA reductase-like NAD-dependent aldehyde dehydrogenase
MTEIRPFLVNGEWRTGESSFEVRNPFDDSVVETLGVPGEADVEEAIAAAHDSFEEASRLSVAARSSALDHISRRLDETQEENAELIAREGGKPLK